MSNILITGSSSGLGKAMFDKLEEQGHSVHGFNIEDGNDVREAKALKEVLDITPFDIDILINNAGVNLIDWLENFEEDMWDKVMDTNAKGIYLMTKACLPSLIKSKGTVVNIVSNAAHIMTLQLARELTKKHGITVFGIAPNKLSGTGMSDSIDEQVVKTRGWTKEYAQEYQLNGLLAGEETPPERLAEFIAFLLQSKEHHKYLTGCILPYGA